MRAISIMLCCLLLFSSVIFTPVRAHATEEKIIQFRSLDDPAIIVDPVICQNAPFYDPDNPPNTLIGASLWSSLSRAYDGVVVNEEVRYVGETYACALITDLSPGARAPFYMEFYVAGLRLSGAGDCTCTSNHIPVGGLFLVGCALSIPPDPSQELLGGVATSSSVFNPLSIPGYQTGSFWTVHLYFE